MVEGLAAPTSATPSPFAHSMAPPLMTAGLTPGVLRAATRAAKALAGTGRPAMTMPGSSPFSTPAAHASGEAVHANGRRTPRMTTDTANS
jgi:hypothetical protein